MKKRMLIIMLSCLLMVPMAFAMDTSMVSATNSEDYIPSETVMTVALESSVVEPVEDTITLEPATNEKVNTDDIDELTKLMNQCQARKKAAHEMAESARALGYEEDNPVIVLAQAEYHNASIDYKYYQAAYNKKVEELKAAEEAKWGTKAAEYPEATQVWRYLSDLGFNDYVCAGIMGNLMAEVGGQTLAIQPYLKGNGYYGMCQWNQGYRSQVWGADLTGQLDFLRDTIQYELDTFGYAYKNGFNYNSFLELTSEEDAALAFAKCYERCGSGSYSQRQRNATAAYNYFVG